MRVVAAINTGLDAGLGVRALFEAPTVAQLAPRIGGQAGGPVVAVPRPRGAVVVCPVPVVVYRAVARAVPVYNMAVALRLGGRWMPEALGAALADVVGRQESLRTLFPAVEGIPAAAVVPVERADFGWQVVDATGWPADRLEDRRRRGASPV